MATLDNTPVPDFASLLRLDGKGFVVLGAGVGMGRQVSHALSQCGAQVLCVDRDSDCAREIAAEVRGTACVADVTQRSGMQAVFEAARRDLATPGGIVDIVGRSHMAPIEKIDDDAYMAQQDVLFRHAWLALQLGAPWLAAAGGGSITFIGSVAGVAAYENQSLYGAQKAALHHLARCAAIEYGPKGVRVNTVAPGATRTPRMNTLMGDAWGPVEASIPLRRAADPADIASIVLFLASPLARHVTAQTIVADGGVTTFVNRPPFKAGAQAAEPPPA